MERKKGVKECRSEQCYQVSIRHERRGEGEGHSHVLYLKGKDSVLGRIFIFTLTFICRFYTASETPVGIEIVQTLVINLLTSIDPC